MCILNNIICILCLLSIALLLIFGIFFAWETRKVRVAVLNDSKEIGICVYNIMIMSFVSVPIYRLLPLQQMDVSFGVISISVYVCAITTLLLVFGPKVWAHRGINEEYHQRAKLWRMCLCVSVCVSMYACGVHHDIR